MRIVIRVSLLILLCSVCMFTQEKLGGGTFYAINGNVIADGAGLADASVFLMVDGNITEATVTDSNGSYSLNAIAGVTYVAGVYKNGYIFEPAFQNLGPVKQNQTVNFQNGVRLCEPAPFGQSGNFCADGVPTAASAIVNGRIAYEVFGNAFAVDADGTNQSQLPPGGAFPSWSFDGARVLYNRDPSTDVGFDQEIFVMNSDGSSFSQLTSNNWSDLRARFSPDGSKIVFDRLVDTSDRGIYTMDSNGANEVRLTPVDVQVQDASFSPDGSKIVYRDGFQIFVMNADGTSPTQLTFTGSDVFNFEPSWSPDGAHIIFISNRGGEGNEVWRMTANGLEVLPLTGDEFDKRTPIYSPDGTMIAFSRERSVGDFREIYTKSLFGGAAQRATVTAQSSNAENPSWRRVVSPSSVTIGNVVVSFANATTAGNTVSTPIPISAAGFLPNGFAPFGVNAFDVRTSSVFSGAVEVCFSFPGVTNQATFDSIVIFHNENGQLVDRTSRRNFATRVVCAAADSLSPFIAAIPVSPTASNGSVTGRVSGVGGASIANAVVRLIRADGQSQSTRTGQFGNFRFDEVGLGQSAVIEVKAKSWTFQPRIVFLQDDVTDVQIVATETGEVP